MTGTNCDLFTHKSSRSYLNHLVLHPDQKSAGGDDKVLQFVPPGCSLFYSFWNVSPLDKGTQ
jgi:hypothetical protein